MYFSIYYEDNTKNLVIVANTDFFLYNKDMFVGEFVKGSEVMYTGTYLNPSNIAFKRALDEDIYIDKSNLIKFCNDRVNKKKSFVCSTRPRRFGKSMAIDMLTAYYSKGCDSKDLFEDLNASKYDLKKKKEKNLNKKYIEYMNAFDVIRIDMQDVMSNSDGDELDAVDWIQREITKELKEIYADCIKEGYALSATLKNIFKLKKKQFIVLIDEWDALFRIDKDNVKLQEKYITFLRSLFKGSNAEEFTAFAYITGILPIKKYGGESALNNFKEFTMTEPKKMVDYIGFTEEEVRALCDKYNMNFSEMEKWYDGYTLLDSELLKPRHIYSPNSVCNALLRKRIKSYWVSTNTYEDLQVYISYNFEGLRDDIITMLAGGRCKADVGMFTNDLISFKSKDEVLACLAHLGYLAYDEEKEEVFIPNKEVRIVFERAVKRGNDYKEVMTAIAKSEQLMKDTQALKAERVADAVAYVHANATSLNKYNDENSLSCAITLAYYSAMNDYKLIRELPSGVGYADVVFVPRPNVVDKPAIVVELKCNKDSKTAIEQIKNRQYGEHLKDYVGKILLVGINYDKDDKNKKHTCIIEELEKTE